MSYGRWLPSTVIFVLWILLFFHAAWQEGEPLAEGLHAAEGLSYLKLFFVALLAWGWTSIALLTVLSSLLGEMLRNDSTHAGLAIARGFLVFLLVVCGQLFTLSESGFVFNFPDNAAWARVALLTSMLGFGVGFRPGLVSHLIRKVETQMGAPEELQKSQKPVPAAPDGA